MLETRSLSEVQTWDLEELDAFLAVLEMQGDHKVAASVLANTPKKEGG